MSRNAAVILLAIGLLGFGTSNAMAQSTPAAADSTNPQPDSTTMAPVPAPPPPPVPAPVTAAPAAAAPVPAAVPPVVAAPAAAHSAPNPNIYYGGQVTLSFGSTTQIGIFPLVGYKITPRLSGGAKAGYEYVSYDNGPDSHNYGGSVFSRYRVGRSLYAHAEYEAFNYDIPTGPNSSERHWVPFLLLGGGLIRPLNARSSAYVEVLVDVLQDENSPYKDWDPIVNFGVGVGF